MHKWKIKKMNNHMVGYGLTPINNLIYEGYLMEKIEKMTLADAEQIEVMDKDTNKKIKKWKYTFFMPDNTIFIGYSDSDKLKPKVHKTGRYDESLAEDFKLTGKVFNGEIKWRLALYA